MIVFRGRFLAFVAAATLVTASSTWGADWADDTTVTLSYSIRVESEVSVISSDIAVDVSGSLLSVGTYASNVDFGGASGEGMLSSRGSEDIFIQKRDPMGRLMWVHSLGGPGNDVPFGVATDSSGNVYVTGQFNGNCDFDPGLGSFVLSGGSHFSSFLLKLSTTGSFVWANNLGALESGYDIAVDASGNVFVCGYNDDHNRPDRGGSADAFIRKLNSDGEVLWSRFVGDSQTERGYSVATDAVGNVYTLGYFNSNSIDVDPGPEVFGLQCSGSRAAFVQKLNPDGEFLWGRSVCGALRESMGDMTVDGWGNVYVALTSTGRLALGPEAWAQVIEAPARSGVYHAVLKLDAEGGFVWSRVMGGDGGSVSQSIAVDRSGNVYAGGIFSGMVDFDPDTGSQLLGSLDDGEDIFVQKLDFLGDFLWARSAGGKGSEGFRGLCLDGERNLYVAGTDTGGDGFRIGATASGKGVEKSNMLLFQLRQVTGPGNVDEDIDAGSDLFESAAVLRRAIIAGEAGADELFSVEESRRLLSTLTMDEFGLLDYNHDGFLSRAELERVTGPLGCFGPGFNGPNLVLTAILAAVLHWWERISGMLHRWSPWAIPPGSAGA